MTIGWNPEAGRYFDTERMRFLTWDEVTAMADESRTASLGKVDALVELYTNKTIGATDFRREFREELKREYIRQYLMGYGGREQMDFEHWGRIGGHLADQYRYLEDFYQDLLENPDMAAGTIYNRARMYVRSSRQSYEAAHEQVMKRLGAEEVLWVLDVHAENCPDCKAFAELGWVPLVPDPYDGARPGSGDTVCLTNCACGLEYRGAEARVSEIEQQLIAQFGG